MELPIPAWFKYRQAEAKPAGDNCYELTAPQMEPAYIRIRRTDGGWQASISEATDGPDLLTTRADLATERDAWQAAFELYRNVEVI